MKTFCSSEEEHDRSNTWFGAAEPVAAKPERQDRLYPDDPDAMVIFVAAGLDVVTTFTNSKLLRRLAFVGFDQYERLWAAPAGWSRFSNLRVFGCLSLFSACDRLRSGRPDGSEDRFENTFRTIMLYPFALSFIVTASSGNGCSIRNTGSRSIVRSLGWTSFSFDPLYNSNIVIYGILIAALWQGTGLVMCLMLAGLRGIDEDIW